MRKLIWYLLLFLSLVLPLGGQGRDYTILSDWKNHNDRWLERQDGGYMLFRRLNERAFELLRQRDLALAGIRTASGWESRRTSVRESLEKLLGPWPERTPLNARTVGVIRRERIRIEKIVFESLPGLHVTAALYVPSDTSRPRPGILYIPGHAANGFRAAHYQNACLNLVHKGFVVLTYDPIGQGERHQELDPVTGEPFVTRRTVPHYKMHSYVGNQCFLAGVSLSRYFIWDAMRGIDYLTSRPEVDPSRIGVTGNSGGGNITVYTGAVDDRVTVAVPSCYVTSYRRMLAISGIQDAEQNVYHALRHGIEHADWLLARAPKPTLLLTTTHDFFPIQGARETEAELRRIYQALGAPENFDRVEDDHGHGYTRRNSEASYAFLMKHLGVPGDPAEKEYTAPTEEDLRVTETGQVATAFRGETVFSINRQETAQLIGRLEESRRQEGHAAEALKRARELSGHQPPTASDDAIYRGGFRLEGYRIEKYALDGGPNAVIPVLLALPDGDGRRPAVIYLHPDGKEAGVGAGGPIEELVRKGYAVLAPDVIGVGETAARIGRQNDHNAAFYVAALIGSSVVGLQAEDLVRVTRWLQSDPRIRPDQVGLLAVGSMGPAATHAAAFHPEIRWLVLDGSLATYASVALNRFYTTPTDALVPGALTAYDLPDLLASIAPRRVAIVGPVNQEAGALTPSAAAEAYRYTASRYQSLGAASSLRLLADSDAAISDMVGWCLGKPQNDRMNP